LKKLQVLLNGKWQYVFCRNPQKREPIVTQNKNNAITGDIHSLTYFQDCFSELQFRINTEKASAATPA